MGGHHTASSRKRSRAGLPLVTQLSYLPYDDHTQKRRGPTPHEATLFPI